MQSILDMQTEMQKYGDQYSDLLKRAGLEKELAFIQENNQKLAEIHQRWVANDGMQKLRQELHRKDLKFAQFVEEGEQLTKKYASGDGISKEELQTADAKCREITRIKADLVAISDPEGAKLMKEAAAAKDRIKSVLTTEFANEYEDLQTRIIEIRRKLTIALVQKQQGTEAATDTR